MKKQIFINKIKIPVLIFCVVVFVVLIFKLLGGFAGIKILTFTNKGEGSVNEFIVKSINDHGGSASIPDTEEMEQKWRFSVDPNGTQIFIYNADFSKVVNFLEMALGPPNPDLGSSEILKSIEDGGGYYSVNDKGLAVSYWDEVNFVHLIILRP